MLVQDDKQLKKILEVKDRLPLLKAIVQWEGAVPADAPKFVYGWDAFLALGKEDASLDEALKGRIAGQHPGHCSTLIYTSGTTGNPKAVMITHDNITWTATSIAEALGIGSDAEIVSFLPLSHIAAQLVDLHAPLATGGTVHFAQPDALKGSLVETLKEVRPTVFLGVPRVWEKIQEKMKKIGSETTGVKKTIATWAKKTGLERGYAEQRGEHKGAMWGLANRIVFSKIRQNLGLDRCKLQATSAAPISKDTLEYFLSIGIPLYEIYGMSECTGPQTISWRGNYRTGSCGKSIAGSDLAIAKPDHEGNGEICFRGRHVFAGYLKDPASTGAVIDRNGFLHSGDVGQVDARGFLTITGRLKELIITAGGENIPPVLIENTIKEHVPFISQVMVIGDRRKFLTCLVTLHTTLEDDGTPTTTLTGLSKKKAEELGITEFTVEAVSKNEAYRKAIEQGIAEANKKAISQAQRIQKFEICPLDFSLPGGELTPTMKLKRRIVNQKYEALIEKMYAENIE